MKLSQLISEIQFDSYQAVVRVKYGMEGVSKYDHALRALPGVTTVTTLSLDSENNYGNYRIKLITQKPPKQAFEAFVENAKSKYKNIISVQVYNDTIEKKL